MVGDPVDGVGHMCVADLPGAAVGAHHVPVVPFGTHRDRRVLLRVEPVGTVHGGAAVDFGEQIDDVSVSQLRGTRRLLHAYRCGFSW